VSIAAANTNGQSVLPYLRERMRAHVTDERSHEFEVAFERSDPNESDAERLMSPSPLTPLRVIARELRAEDSRVAESVFLAGAFAYDLVDQFEDLPAAEPGERGPAHDFPDYWFVLADQLIAIDHLSQRAEVFVNVFGGAHAAANYYSAQDVVAHVAGLAGRLDEFEPAAHLGSGDAMLEPGMVAVDVGDREFAETIVRLKQRIVAGDVFQIVPSRSFSLECPDPLAAYAALRSLNPSPYMFYLNSGDFILFGASPESAVKVDGVDRSVEISPIAGTRPRGFRADGGIDADLDGRIEAELRLDEKENAEHMMLVDLARNDVARVALPGSRYVPELAQIVRYSHVMHLVSRVRGTLREDLDALHAYQASLNMGTLTGAPKIKAMQLIRAAERTRRGPYGGAVGYLRGDGSLDTAIAIRSALVRNGTATVRAGAGVVHDSVPQLEADETRRKAEAVLRAIAAANSSRAGRTSG
jgi:anthranilate synthase component 1